MPFVLRHQLPSDISEMYWSHNSGCEHTEKQSGEIPEINDLRVRCGKEPFQKAELLGYMYNSGVVAVHTTHKDGGVGPTIGYVVADRNARYGRLDVKDLYVEPKHRHRGVGGFLLGRLITNMIPVSGNTPGIITRNYGNTLFLNGDAYRLPGIHITVMESTLGKNEVAKMRKAMPPDWSGLREIIGEDSYEATLHDLGSVVASFGRHIPGHDDELCRYNISGRTGDYLLLAYAAIAALNVGKSGVV
jgi:GNAT superfamily N-acetyltransferase